MKMIKLPRLLAAALPAALSAALPAAPIAFAQEEPETTASESADAQAMSKSLAIMDTIMAVFDTSDAPPIAEDQLALARITSAAILPTGTYARMMEKTFNQVLAPMQQLFSTITPEEIAKTTGVDPDRIHELSSEEMKQVSEIIDPERRKRGNKVFDIMIPLMKDAFTEIEPALREGMARAYARKFTGEQLKELNAFFKTPTGSLYASESFIIMADPEIMSATMQAMPTVMEKVFSVMPEMEEEMQNTAQPRTLADMDKAELKQLAGLLSVKTGALEEYRDAVKDAAPANEDVAEPEEDEADVEEVG